MRMKLKSKADGFEFEAYHAQPKDARRGGLVLIQEIFGVTPGIQRLADGFAEAGYEVLAPQMFDRCERDFDVERRPADRRQGLRLCGRGRLGAGAGRRAGLYRRPEAAGVHRRLLLWRYGGLAGGGPLHGPDGGVLLLRPRHRRPAGRRTPQGPDHPAFRQDRTTTSRWSTGERIADAHPDIPLYLYDADHGFYSDDRPDYRVEPAELSKLRTLQLFHRAASGKVEMWRHARPSRRSAGSSIGRWPTRYDIRVPAWRSDRVRQGHLDLAAHLGVALQAAHRQDAAWASMMPMPAA